MFRLRAASEDDTIYKSKVWLIPSSVLPMKIRPCANRGGSFFCFCVFIVVDYKHHMVRKLLSLLKGAFQFVIVLKIYSRLDDIFHQY